MMAVAMCGVNNTCMIRYSDQDTKLVGMRNTFQFSQIVTFLIIICKIEKSQKFRYVDAICIIAETGCWKLSFTPTLVILFQYHFYRQPKLGTFEQDLISANAGPQNAGFRPDIHSDHAENNDRFGIPDYRPAPFQIPHPELAAADTIHPHPG